METIEILKAEHQIILKKLSEIKALLPGLSTGDLASISEHMNFIQIYADKYHHAKEEDILFPWMIAQRPDLEFGPIACMLKEHDLGRALIETVIAIIESPLASKDMELIQRHLGNFVDILVAHIAKEDDVLYEIAEMLDLEHGRGDTLMMPGFLAVRRKLGEGAECHI